MESKDLSSAKLQASFQNFAHNSSIIFYRCSLEQHNPIVEISENTKELLGLETEAFYEDTALWMNRIHPDNRPYVNKLYRKTIDHERQTLVYRFKHSEGHYIWLRDERMLEYGEDGKPAAIIGTAIDISRQKKAEHELYELGKSLEKRIEERAHELTAVDRKQINQLRQNKESENRDISEQVKYRDALEKSLLEKDTLLAEVHHRVKNNLAVISGLLEMQSFNADNEEIADALQESQSRIQSIATVHEILYQSDSFANIELNLYIDQLVPYVARTFNQDETNIHFEKEVDSISLTVKQAVPCGLLLNELITNAYKHAFRGRDEGTIYISMHRSGSTIELEVRDNGIGLPADLDADRPSSLGMKLIKTLITQLDGSLTVEEKPFTTFHIVFEAED